MKHLDIAGLLSVQVLRRSHGDLQAEDRLQLADRLGVSIIDDERPQPLLEQVRILALRQVQLRVQGGGFHPILPVAGPLNGHLTEDRQRGTPVWLLQPGQVLVRVRGRITRDPQRRADVPSTGHIQERLEQPVPDHQEIPENGLLDLRNRLTSVAGVLHVFDHVPERLESVVDLHREAACSGVDERSNLTAATGRVSMILAPLHCGVYRD